MGLAGSLMNILDFYESSLPVSHVTPAPIYIYIYCIENDVVAWCLVLAKYDLY